jgi:hypothetical protein
MRKAERALRLNKLSGGRGGLPVVFDMILKHLRHWSYDTLEREVRAIVFVGKSGSTSD